MSVCCYVSFQEVENRHEEVGMHGGRKRKCEAYLTVR
jgi:hypothetical protein